ncbi:phage regulatory CII family protein [Metapseudomonas lalkuanensis]|uniref:phage regulatory CII family protein n=1 Tax=Metapseudomonas lalkuanensis TaxID=2604832 RepID=UPI001CF58473|nr:phage regulatory CII family protein [Pseudomonas lalkuanensis]UCP00080.1 phage regulatory CII family protein [Pseudomonas lalkuanensis]
MEEFHRALHDTVLEAGPKTLAHLMGMSHTSLLNRSNPNDDTHRLNIEQFLQILVHSNDVRTLKVLAAEFGYELVPKQPARKQNLTGALVHMNAEVADVTRTVADAVADQHLTSLERAAILREADQAIDSLHSLKASVKAA